LTHRARPVDAEKACAQFRAVHRSLLAALLFFLPAVAAAVAACGDDTVLTSTDGGGPDATLDAQVEAGDAGSEASCAVDAGALDPSQVALGQQLVASTKCTSCHGDALTGNPNGVPSTTVIGGTAYPPNLTPDPATGLGCWSNDQIVNAILNGIDNEGMTLCAPMPLFGSLGDGGLDVAGAQAVAVYLRSLQAVSMNVPNTPDCPVGADGGPPEAGSDAAPEASSDAGDASTPDVGSDTAVDAGADAADAPSDATGEGGG
jgi:cytochrome c553